MNDIIASKGNESSLSYFSLTTSTNWIFKVIFYICTEKVLEVQLMVSVHCQLDRLWNHLGDMPLDTAERDSLD